MIRLVWRSITERRARSLLLLMAVLVVSASFGLLLSAAETSKVTVDQNLEKYWRTTYDILVRPPGNRSLIEEKYDLVQTYHLGNILGGISFEQFEAIKRIPGVDVAAPIAMLSYFDLRMPLSFLEGPTLTEEGVYKIEVVLWVDDGTGKRETRRSRYLLVSEARSSMITEQILELSSYGIDVTSLGIFGGEINSWTFGEYMVPVLLAAVDPQQEARLVGLDRIVNIGRYFSDSSVPVNLPRAATYYSEELDANFHDYHIPVLMNARSYVDTQLRLEVYKVVASGDSISLEETILKKGRLFLDGLPLEQLGISEVRDAEAQIYQLWLQHQKNFILYPWSGSYTMFRPSYSPQIYMTLPKAPQYAEIQVSWDVSYPVLELTSEGIAEEDNSCVRRTPEVEYRSVARRRFEGTEEGDFTQIEAVKIGGIDIGELEALVEGVTHIPLETYFPPDVTLRYTEDGAPVDPPVDLFPILNPLGYIQRPPVLLTTLEAARLFNETDPISAVRIQVGGIDRYSPAAQSRIEAVASEIVEVTGLDVDIVVGSSPRKILIHVPGDNGIPPIGYMEEQWIQKGVNLNIGRKVQRENLIFFGLILSVCTLNVLNTGLMTALGRQRETALQKALGWRSSMVFKVTLLEMGLVGLLAGGIGAVLAWVIAQIFSLDLPVGKAILIVPLGVALCLLGGIIPAMRTSRVSLAVTIREGEMHIGKRRSAGKRSLLGYVLRSLMRRRIRTILVIVTMALSAGLLTVFMAATLGLRGYLSGTLLGEYLLLRIEGYHYLMTGVCLLVAGITVADALLVSTFERTREIGLLKAVGWRSGQVLQLFLEEGTLLGLVGGCAGVAAGVSLIWVLYGDLPKVVGLIALVGLMVTLVIGLLAAIIPGILAARTPPAEALQYE